MDIPRLDTIELDPLTRELLADVRGLARRVDDLRPLGAEVLARVRREILGERIHQSNAIEGNTLSLRETRLVLETGQIVDVGRPRESLEVLGLADAIARIEELIPAADPVSDQDRFLEVHDILFRRINADWAGRYRHEDVLLRGARHQPPAAERVDELVTRAFEELRTAVQPEPLLRAAWIHWAVARIHPFRDGNGRMARLWQDLVLFRHGLTAGIVRLAERDEYYRALEQADDGLFDRFVQLVARSVSATLQVYLVVEQETDPLADWASRIVGSAVEEDEGRRAAEHVRWSLDVARLKDAFERCAVQINRASGGALRIDLVSYPLVDLPTWSSLRFRADDFRIWYFRLVCRRDARIVQYVFSFARRVAGDDADAPRSDASTVALLVDEQVARDAPVRLGDGSPLAFREVLCGAGRFHRRRFDPDAGRDVWDDDVDPLRIAQDFLADVVARRLSPSDV